jgi:hypothetical protein
MKRNWEHKCVECNQNCSNCHIEKLATLELNKINYKIAEFAVFSMCNKIKMPSIRNDCCSSCLGLREGNLKKVIKLRIRKFWGPMIYDKINTWNKVYLRLKNRSI